MQSNQGQIFQEWFKRRLQSIYFAGKGIGYVIKTEPQAWFLIAKTISAIIFGFLFQLKWYEWALIIIVLGIVWITELLYRGILAFLVHSQDIDHQQFRHIKNILSGTVLICFLMASVIALFVFLPKFMRLI